MVLTMPRKPTPMVRISYEIYGQLRDLARINGVTIQDAVEFAVEQWIAEARKERQTKKVA